MGVPMRIPCAAAGHIDVGISTRMVLQTQQEAVTSEAFVVLLWCFFWQCGQCMSVEDVRYIFRRRKIGLLNDLNASKCLIGTFGKHVATVTMFFLGKVLQKLHQISSARYICFGYTKN